MAKIVEENIIIKISKLVKTDDAVESVVSDELLVGMEEIAASMISDPAAVVEVVRGVPML